MKIAIVHYHLRHGGVTNVIQSTQEALRGTGVEILVISGEEPAEGITIDNLVVIPGLQYRKTAFLSMSEGLADALKDAAENHFGSQPDVWHFHNHNLGKNVLMPLAITSLAEEKASILLQMHDFPEDGRPKNYVAQRSFFDLEKDFRRTLYPLASHIHYATINQRDRNFLKAAGMIPDQLHLLPNSVTGIKPATTPDQNPFSKGKRFILYPTRAIRRKNIGELLLLALAYGDQFDFATSLVPENPEWFAVYEQWRGLAQKMKLPISFGIGQDGQHQFSDLIGWSDAILTTSIAEGFGLAFLEPWLSGKSVVGRNLPRITSDFEASGISLDHLYERIEVPLDWVGESELRKTADETLRRIYLAYDRPLSRHAVDQTFSRWVVNGCVDFGMLHEDFQRKVILKVAADPGALKALNLPSLEPSSEAVIATNRQLVETFYSVATYGENLLALYQKIAKSPRSKVSSLNPQQVLKQFLDPWRLNLLRT
jgi:glycosyltransferase involved in cell wall biosynthesis